jgi:hypothetical protein
MTNFVRLWIANPLFFDMHHKICRNHAYCFT